MSPTSCQTAPPRINRWRILQTWLVEYKVKLVSYYRLLHSPILFGRDQQFTSKRVQARSSDFYQELKLNAQTTPIMCTSTLEQSPQPQGKWSPVKSGDADKMNDIITITHTLVLRAEDQPGVKTDVTAKNAVIICITILTGARRT